MLRILPLIEILVISITTQQTHGSYIETINYNKPPAASLFDASSIPTTAGACDVPGVMNVANQYTGATSSISADEGANALGASVYDGYHVENSQNIPYTAMNTRGSSVTTAVAYPHSKGEILIHRPAPIIVKRPPTKVVVNHPPLVVKPAPVVLHKPPSVVVRRVYVKQHPRPVKVEPVYVNVVKPPAEKYYVNEKQQQQQHQHQHQHHQHQQQYHLEAQPSVAYASINTDGAATNAAAAPFSIANDASSYRTFSLTNPEPHRLSATGAMLSYDAPRSVFPSNYNASPSY